MDVYGHLLAPAKMQAADAIRRALWLEDLPDFDPAGSSERVCSSGSSVESQANEFPGLQVWL